MSMCARSVRFLIHLAIVLTATSLPLCVVAQEKPEETASDATEAPGERTDEQESDEQESDEQESDEAGYATSEEKLLEAADEIAGEVARIRGLPVKHEIDKGIKKREELRAVLVKKLAEEVSDEDIEAEGKVYKRLGLLGPEVEYKKVLLDVLTEQIAGFYDQKAKSLYIMQGIPLSLQRPAMAHEIYHAIQDQHFDILRLQQPFTTTENGDFALARSALIEGDATVVMFDFSLYEAGTLPQEGVSSVVDIPMIANILKRLSFDDLTAIEKMFGSQASGGGFGTGEISDSALGNAPPIFRDLLMFPYFAGMRFIVMARTGRTWEEVDAIYQNPPVSTEQILHPERYFSQDDPVHLTFDAAPALEGWEKIYDSVMGEFQTLLFLRHHLMATKTSLDASEVAKGWDGDRLVAFEKGDRVVVAHLSAWDSVSEAKEYVDALREIVRIRTNDAITQSKKGKYGESTCYLIEEEGASERIYVERWGDMVLHIEGTPSSPDIDGKEQDSTTYRLREVVWQTYDRVPLSRVIDEKMEAIREDEEAAAE